MNDDAELALNDGRFLPRIAQGTFAEGAAGAGEAVRAALDAGFRLIDSASVYENEEAVGEAIRSSGIDREEVRWVTKLRPDITDPGAVLRNLEDSLRFSGLDYTDLWLIHWPSEGVSYAPVWERFIEAKDRGLARSIGVSNFTVAQIDELVAVTGVTPAVNQIRWTPSNFDESVLRAHRERGIRLMAWSPFRGGDMTLASITSAARAHGVTAHQVVLAWNIAHEVIPVPRSFNPSRITANLAGAKLALSHAEVSAIDAQSGTAGAP